MNASLKKSWTKSNRQVCQMPTIQYSHECWLEKKTNDQSNHQNPSLTNTPMAPKHNQGWANPYLLQVGSNYPIETIHPMHRCSMTMNKLISCECHGAYAFLLFYEANKSLFSTQIVISTLYNAIPSHPLSKRDSKRCKNYNIVRCYFGWMNFC